MALVTTRDINGLIATSLNLTKQMTDTIAAKVATYPAGRMNPWYHVTLIVSGVNRSAYVKVVNGQTTEVNYV